MKIFKFIEYLEVLLIKTHRKIVPHDYSFLIRYAQKFERFYADILDHINREIYNGDVMKMEKFITKNVNGVFTNTLKYFLKEYDENY